MAINITKPKIKKALKKIKALKLSLEIRSELDNDFPRRINRDIPIKANVVMIYFKIIPYKTLWLLLSYPRIHHLN